MSISSREIFLVRFENKTLLHAPLHGITSLLNESAAEELSAWIASSGSFPLSKSTAGLGQLLAVKEPCQPSEMHGAFSPSSVGLLTTNDCNLRCLYCAQNAGESRRLHMSREICSAALKCYADIVERERYQQFGVNFFGGEPTQGWDIVQYADEVGRRHAEALDIPYYSTCTTNGVMSQHRARWIANHLSFALVSLDGPPDVQDMYRPTRLGKSTHETVTRTLRVFQDENLPFALRCSVGSGIVDRIPEIIEYFCSEFHPAVINLEPLVMHGRCLQTGLQAPTAAAFVNGVVKAGKTLRAYGVDLKFFTAQTDSVGHSPCGVSEDNLVVTPDGLLASCYSITSRQSPGIEEYAIGEIDEQTGTVTIDMRKVAQMRAYRVANIPRCAGCFAKWHCAGGCRVYHTPPFCREAPSTMCLLTQRLTLWRLLGHLHLVDEADRVSLQAEEMCHA